MKKLMALVTALLLTASVSAIELDTPETIENGDEYAASVAEKEAYVVKPGYNVYTGTADPFTFDGELTVADSGTTADIIKNWSGSFIDTTTEPGNPSMKLAHSGNAGVFAVNTSFELEKTRPFTASFKYKASATGVYIVLAPNEPVFTWQTNWATRPIYNSGALSAQYADNTWHSMTKELTISSKQESSLTSLWFCEPTSGSALWIDDVKLIPHYKVSYNLGDGTSTDAFADEYFYANSYTLKADTTKITPPDGKFFLGWQDQLGNRFDKGYVVPTPGCDLELTAVYGTPVVNNAGKPGYNVWTGTTDPYTFEGKLLLSDDDSGDINKSWANGISLEKDENGNTSIKLSGDHPNFTVNNEFAPIEKTRPISIRFDFKTTAANDLFFRVRPNLEGRWKMIDGKAQRCINGILQVNLGKKNDGNWFTSTTQGISLANFSDIDIPSLDTVDKLWFFIAQGDAAWFDNISIVPNYKVSYDLGDGTGTLADEYFDTFYSASYKLKADTSKITAPEGTVFSHWVDKNGKIVRDTVTPTLGEDIKLTAVYAKVLTLGMANINVVSPKGMRVAGFIARNIRNTADEYGFIVSLASTFENGDYTALTHAGDSTKYVSAAAYVKDTDIDHIACDDSETAKDKFGEYAVNADGIYFTGVYTGVPEKAESYTAPIVGRTYVKIGETYFYGVPNVNTIYETAKAIADGEENVPEYVQKIIDIVETN